MSGGTLYAQNAQAFTPTPVNVVPATLAASGVWQSGLLNAAGFRALAAGCTLSQAGTIAIQRYLDQAGLVAIGISLSQAITATVPATVTYNDGQPALTWQVTITNTSGSTGNLTNVALLAAV